MPQDTTKVSSALASAIDLLAPDLDSLVVVGERQVADISFPEFSLAESPRTDAPLSAGAATSDRVFAVQPRTPKTPAAVLAYNRKKRTWDSRPVEGTTDAIATDGFVAFVCDPTVPSIDVYDKSLTKIHTRRLPRRSVFLVFGEGQVAAVDPAGEATVLSWDGSSLSPSSYWILPNVGRVRGAFIRGGVMTYVTDSHVVEFDLSSGDSTPVKRDQWAGFRSVDPVPLGTAETANDRDRYFAGLSRQFRGRSAYRPLLSARGDVVGTLEAPYTRSTSDVGPRSVVRFRDGRLFTLDAEKGYLTRSGSLAFAFDARHPWGASSKDSSYRGDIVWSEPVATSRTRDAYPYAIVPYLPDGVHGTIPDSRQLRWSGPMTIAVWVRPVGIEFHRRGVLSREGAFSLELDGDGAHAYFAVDGFSELEIDVPASDSGWVFLLAEASEDGIHFESRGTEPADQVSGTEDPFAALSSPRPVAQVDSDIVVGDRLVGEIGEAYIVKDVSDTSREWVNHRYLSGSRRYGIAGAVFYPAEGTAIGGYYGASSSSLIFMPSLGTLVLNDPSDVSVRMGVGPEEVVALVRKDTGEVVSDLSNVPAGTYRVHGAVQGFAVSDTEQVSVVVGNWAAFNSTSGWRVLEPNLLDFRADITGDAQPVLSGDYFPGDSETAPNPVTIRSDGVYSDSTALADRPQYFSPEDEGPYSTSLEAYNEQESMYYVGPMDLTVETSFDAGADQWTATLTNHVLNVTDEPLIDPETPVSFLWITDISAGFAPGVRVKYGFVEPDGGNRVWRGTDGVVRSEAVDGPPPDGLGLFAGFVDPAIDPAFGMDRYAPFGRT